MKEKQLKRAEKRKEGKQKTNANSSEFVKTEKKKDEKKGKKKESKKNSIEIKGKSIGKNEIGKKKAMIKKALQSAPPKIRKEKQAKENKKTIEIVAKTFQTWKKPMDAASTIAAGNRKQINPIQTKSETLFVKKSCLQATAKNKRKTPVLKRKKTGRDFGRIIIFKKTGNR